MVIIIPGLKLHEKWEIKLLGKSLVKIDEFIDDPYKPIDTHLLMRIMRERGKREPFDYYLNYMRDHDPWRLYNDVFFLYIYEKFSADGLDAAYLHVFLDLFAMDVMRATSADLTTFRTLVDGYIRRAEGFFLMDLPEFLARLKRVGELVKANLSDILSDILEWRKIMDKTGRVEDIERIRVYHEPYVLARNEKDLIDALKKSWFKSFEGAEFIPPKDLSYYRRNIREFVIARNILDKLFQMNVPVTYFEVTQMDLGELKRVQSRLRDIASLAKIGTKYSRRHAFFEISGKNVSIAGGYVLIITYKDGSEIFYPHSIQRENTRVEIRPLDFLISLLETGFSNIS